MSIAISPALHEELREYAKQKMMSASAYVSEIVEKAVKVDVDDELVIVSSNQDVLNLSLETDLYKQLQEYTQKRNTTMNAFVADLLKQLLKVAIEDEPVVIGKPVGRFPVIFMVPATLKHDKEGFKNWLLPKVEKVLNS
jgi:predicted HicB family RNase H-like nuclease